MPTNPNDPAALAQALIASPESGNERIAAMLTALLGKPQTAEDGGSPYLVLPDGYQVQDLARLLPTPLRFHANTQHTTLASFASYVAAYRSVAPDERTVLWCNLDSNPPSITAILDYHGDAPSHATHRATYKFTRDQNWEIWRTRNAQRMSQQTLAEFLEDNAHHIVAPDSATLIEIAAQFTAKQKITFLAGLRLASGDRQLTYTEETDARKGAIDVPEKFTIRLPLFQGGGAIDVLAKFRYRITDGALTTWYEIANLAQLERDAANADIATLADQELDTYYGTPQ